MITVRRHGSMSPRCSLTYPASATMRPNFAISDGWNWRLNGSWNHACVPLRVRADRGQHEEQQAHGHEVREQREVAELPVVDLHQADEHHRRRPRTRPPGASRSRTDRPRRSTATPSRSSPAPPRRGRRTRRSAPSRAGRQCPRRGSSVVAPRARTPRRGMVRLRDRVVRAIGRQSPAGATRRTPVWVDLTAQRAPRCAARSARRPSRRRHPARRRPRRRTAARPPRAEGRG